MGPVGAPLIEHRFPMETSTVAARHAAWLLRRLGARVHGTARHRSDAELGPPERLASTMVGAALAFRTLAGRLGRRVDLDGPALLERGVDGRPGPDRGRPRLIRARDGLVAVNLPRPADWDLLAAWLGWRAPGRGCWADVASGIRRRPAHELAASAGELGLAVTPCPAPGAVPADAQVRHRHGRGPVTPWVLHRGGGAAARARPVRVVDLSALWAGPLLGSLLARAGADVVKVEDPRRADVARPRASALSRRLQRSKRLLLLDLHHERDRLAALVAEADVVIESSRPRALDGLGLGPRHGLSPSQIWVSVTAHGRTGPWSGRAGYGDDCAAGGGLYLADPRGPRFVGDAAADPLTGLHGAVAVLACLLGGWSGHVDLALRDAATAAVGCPDR